MDKNKVYAIVGASNNSEKYGYHVLKDLNDAGYKVVPVNLTEVEILGLKVSKSLSEIKEKPDVVIFVVPPSITEQVLKEVKALGIVEVWMQPGSESESAIAFCKQNNIECVHNACIMIEKENV